MDFLHKLGWVGMYPTLIDDRSLTVPSSGPSPPRTPPAPPSGRPAGDGDASVESGMPQSHPVIVRTMLFF